MRRRNHIVLRDEKEFKPGTDIPNSIKENIFRSNIFIAIWCKEYACSPWCFDELNLALDRLEQKKVPMWIICVDDTRMVPPKARDLLHYKVRSREELEGKILHLLEGSKLTSGGQK
ncbi:toll/interleukin-1 receptor domain-containing protein [Flavilitoribacter nigricans]|uniref:TIR domain-containing protein n=1 Tax=Flavilitoribacter nigricans (strain ATCC 23147 / DSM 23189 / NBRC 102662 / NCIMB 1420 / SS-2) TaxID=1122177 RepID=A0A2D0MX31_FLAN2|nr:hypothetical protein CRP01_40865 [Flavilitoribacter nigricans DSM 23189 = NBRC 102662]